MAKKELTHVVGAFLIQAEGAFLNGAGTEPYGEGDITIPKTFMTLRDGRQTPIPYVSSQAWKRWLRDTFSEENPSDERLEILTTDVNKQNNTNKVGFECDPVRFAEADVFGFMKAEKGQGKAKEIIDVDEDGEPPEENQATEKHIEGKEKVKASIRTSPFQASILVSLRKTGWEGIDKGFVHPKGLAPELAARNPEANPTPLPYNTKFYNTQLYGIFGLAYSRLGVFRNEGDRIELEPRLETAYLEEGKIERDRDFPDRKLYKMTSNPRKSRATKVLNALAVMRGGAKQAQFATPVHPQALIIAGLTTGNLIFNNIFEDSANGPRIKITTLEEVLNDYSSRLASDIYIGIRTGYLEPENEKHLRKWATSTDEQGRTTARSFKQIIEDSDRKVENLRRVYVCTPVEAATRISHELPQ